MNVFGAAYHVLTVSRYVNAECRAGEVDLTNQLHVAIKDHDLRPVMELCAPRSKSHDRAVVVGFGAHGRALKRTRARDGIGTEHLGTIHIEQHNLAGEPVREICAKRTYRGAVP